MKKSSLFENQEEQMNKNVELLLIQQEQIPPNIFEAIANLNSRKGGWAKTLPRLDTSLMGQNKLVQKEKQTLKKKTSSEERIPDNLRSEVMKQDLTEQTQKMREGSEVPIQRMKTREYRVNLDAQGILGWNSKKTPFAEELELFAREIFMYYIHSLPGELVARGYLRTYRYHLQSTFYVFQEEGNWKVSLKKPFVSPFMNEHTTKVFDYFQAPKLTHVKVRGVKMFIDIDTKNMYIQGNLSFFIDEPEGG